MISLTEEFKIIKSEFWFLKEKLASIETQVHRLESRLQSTANEKRSSPSLSEYRAQPTIKECQYENIAKLPQSFVLQDLNMHARNIIEELMWESTISKAVLQVRETFKDAYSREMFLRYSFELVLEKDEQYRKMIGTLVGYLLNQNVINQSNIFNSLCSVLLVIENSNNYNTKIWQNLIEILLPIITESHIKVFQLQRKVQAILKQEYYHEFSNHLISALEINKKQKTRGDNTSVSHAVLTYDPPIDETATEAKSIVIDGKPVVEPKINDALRAQMKNQQNCFDLENNNFYKFKTPSLFEDMETENCKKESENLLKHLISNENLDEAINRIKKMRLNYDLNYIVEGLIEAAMPKETEHRLAMGALLAKCIKCNLGDAKLVLTSLCSYARSVEKLISNPDTRTNVCTTFAEILSPLVEPGFIKINQLETIASTFLPEETRAIFIWLIEKILNDRGIKTAPISQPVPPQSNLLTNKVLKRLRKYYTEEGDRLHENGDDEVNFSKTKQMTMLTKRNEMIANDQAPEAADKVAATDSAERETYLTLKRKKLLKERIENIGDKSDIKIEELLADASVRKTQDGETGDAQIKADQSKTEVDQAPPIKQPENLPSTAIKEKMEEIIEHLIETGAMDQCVNVIKDSFNECQTDLVFKAAFEYTKDKPSEYRIQSGMLIAEAYKHDPKRIGAQIMNTISLELGDFVDSPGLWKSIAEIICPPVICGLVRFTDFKLLPKYFKHTPYCTSLLLALFNEICTHKGPDWLEENWKNSKLDLTEFLPGEMVYKFITDNNLKFMVKDEELSHFRSISTNV